LELRLWFPLESPDCCWASFWNYINKNQLFRKKPEKENHNFHFNWFISKLKNFENSWKDKNF
jgi:hypothetical protein